MSVYFSRRFSALKPYVPGEQPQDRQYLKLNTNENPYPPTESAAAWAREHLRPCNLYSDPDNLSLRAALAAQLKLDPDEVIVANGSDEVLNWAFMAFCDERTPANFADLTYGFYPVFADVNRVPWAEIPLREDYTLCPEDYCGLEGTVFIANPNAPTGMALKPADIERVLQANSGHVVVVDEAYVDFGAESCVPLIREYDNLLVTQTFSKSRSMAGARLGIGIANPELIRDLKTVQFSTNPYNIDSVTMAAGTACVENDEYNMENCRRIIETREWARQKFEELGFEVTPSRTNFLFARHPEISGEDLYLKLKEQGVLIRHFSVERIRDYNRITIGTREDMETVIEKISRILKA